MFYNAVRYSCRLQMRSFKKSLPRKKYYVYTCLHILFSLLFPSTLRIRAN